MRDRDCVILELVDDPKSPAGKSPRVTYPSDVVKAPDIQALTVQLLKYKVYTSKSQASMLRYVEKIRPALRFFCMAFEVGVPEWLQTDAHLVDVPDEEKQKMFGTTDVHTREFRPLVKRRGESDRATH